MKTLALTDNPRALSLAREIQGRYGDVGIYQSPSGKLASIPPLDVNRDIDFIVNQYGLVISIHCKQIFSAALISRVRCVNVHPGYNPYNRGWFPHVFSMVNGKKAGVTIHEIDEQLDHGAIIVQREVIIQPWDTSETVYENLMRLESELLLEWFVKIRDRSYVPYLPSEEGNLNNQKDYELLRRLDLDRVGHFGEFLNILRALTHGAYKNAYFIDEMGQRIYVRVELEKEVVK
jgi:methionyl-tRNA formyltransferase